MSALAQPEDLRHRHRQPTTSTVMSKVDSRFSNEPPCRDQALAPTDPCASHPFVLGGIIQAPLFQNFYQRLILQPLLPTVYFRFLATEPQRTRHILLASLACSGARIPLQLPSHESRFRRYCPTWLRKSQIHLPSLYTNSLG